MKQLETSQCDTISSSNLKSGIQILYEMNFKLIFRKQDLEIH